MHVCMYVCMHACTYVHKLFLYIYIYVHMYVYIYICVYIYTYVLTHTYVHTYIHTDIHTYTYIHTYIPRRICLCLCICMYMYVYMYILYVCLYMQLVCRYIHACIYIYIYIYMLTPPPPPDRPLWGRGRVVSVPMHAPPTDGRQSPLPYSIPKFPNFQHSPQPFFPKFPKCLSYPPNVEDRLCQMRHRFLENNLELLELFLVFSPLLNFLKCLAILEISTRSCNALSPNLSLSLNFSSLSIGSILFLVLTLVPRLLFVAALILVAVLVFVFVLWQY